jgi:CheY-specific phosphatase CheX
MQDSDANELRTMVISSAQHILPACGLPIGDPIETPLTDTTKQVVAFMGFTGDVLRGTIAVVAPLDLIRKAYPLPLDDAARWELEVFDWAGEIANRLLGRIKLLLTPGGISIEASTPRVMLGEQLHVTRSTQGTVCSTCFPVGNSWVRVWFDAICAEGRPLFVQTEARTVSIPPEGDVLLF